MAPSKLDEFPTPPYTSLPLDPNGPPGNAWGRFGWNDELGMLNLLKPAVVATAAREITTGERIAVDLPLDAFPVPFFERLPFGHNLRNWDSWGHPATNDDVLTFNTQSSSQWDGFRHYGRIASNHGGLSTRSCRV